MVQSRACRCEEELIYQIDIPASAKLYWSCCCYNSYLQCSEPFNSRHQCECCCFWSSYKGGYKRIQKCYKYHSEIPICPCFGFISLVSIPCCDDDVPCTCTLLPCCLVYPKCCKCFPKYSIIKEHKEEQERNRIEREIQKKTDNNENGNNNNLNYKIHNNNNNSKEKVYYPGSPITSELQIIGQNYKACRCNADGSDDLQYDTDIPLSATLCYGDCYRQAYYQFEEPCRCRSTAECLCFWRSCECGWKNPTKICKCHQEISLLPCPIGYIQTCSYPNCWDDDVECLISLLPFTLSYPRCVICPTYYSTQKISHYYDADADDDEFDLHQNQPRVMRNRNTDWKQ